MASHGWDGMGWGGMPWSQHGAQTLPGQDPQKYHRPLKEQKCLGGTGHSYWGDTAVIPQGTGQVGLHSHEHLCIRSAVHRALCASNAEKSATRTLCTQQHGRPRCPSLSLFWSVLQCVSVKL